MAVRVCVAAAIEVWVPHHSHGYLITAMGTFINEKLQVKGFSDMNHIISLDSELYPLCHGTT